MSDNIISNEKIDIEKLERARRIILDMQNKMQNYIKTGNGPFIASIYDDKGNKIVEVANSVEKENCSNNHAEMNAIKEAQKKLDNYDLSKYNLSIYVTAEPCMMCIGGIMWSGIKNVYYGVPSADVEKITGFDEGFKPFWFDEFKKRGITVYGNIEAEIGKSELKKYVEAGKTVYKPTR